MPQDPAVSTAVGRGETIAGTPRGRPRRMRKRCTRAGAPASHPQPPLAQTRVGVSRPLPPERCRGWDVVPDPRGILWIGTTVI